MKKPERNQTVLKLFLFFAFWLIQLCIWGWVWMEYYADDIMRPFGYKGNWLVFAVYGFLSLVASRLYGSDQVGFYRKWDLAVSGLVALFLTNGITYLQTCLIGRAIMAPPPFLVMTLVQSVLLVIWAYLAGIIYVNCFPPAQMPLVSGGTPVTAALIQKMLSRSDRYTITEIISAEDSFAEITGKILSYRAVILCDLPAKLRNKLLKFCFQHSIRTYTTPKLSDIIIRGGMEITLFDSPLLLSRNHGLSYGQELFKRMLDLALALPALLILSPFMLCIALSIKCSDGGSVFFLQDRCTINNKVFKIVKFRSLIMNAGPEPVTEGDSRVTPVGRFLRAFRLDELPQLFNVIKGDMSLVGPRPERVELVEQYTRQIPEFSFRSKVKGGITGYAQVMGRYNTVAYDKLKMDLMYITNYSFLSDVKLILMTLKILLIKESSQGFKRLSSEKISKDSTPET